DHIELGGRVLGLLGQRGGGKRHGHAQGKQAVAADIDGARRHPGPRAAVVVLGHAFPPRTRAVQAWTGSPSVGLWPTAHATRLARPRRKTAAGRGAEHRFAPPCPTNELFQTTYVAKEYRPAKGHGPRSRPRGPCIHRCHRCRRMTLTSWRAAPASSDGRSRTRRGCTASRR